MYISSMCLGASLAVTVFSAAETINSFAGPVMQVIVLLFEFPVFIWLMTSLMLFPKNFRDGIASVTCNANLVFAASVLLLILSVAFNHIYPRLAYRKFTAFTLRK